MLLIPTEAQQQTLLAVLAQQLFAPLPEILKQTHSEIALNAPIGANKDDWQLAATAKDHFYLNESLLAQRLTATKHQLRNLIGNHKGWLLWLLTADYQQPANQQYYYRHSRYLILDLIAELDTQGELLTSIIQAKESPRYVRRHALNILAEQGFTACLMQVVDTCFNVTHADALMDYELFDTLLQIIAEQELKDALPYLQRLQTFLADKPRQELTQNSHEQQLFIARAALGDLSLLSQVIELSYDPWRHNSEPAKQALKRLKQQPGEIILLQQLSPQSNQDDSLLEAYIRLTRESNNGLIRCWVLQQYLVSEVYQPQQPVTIAYLLSLLSDENWYVMKTAAEALIAIGQAAIPALYAGLQADNTPLKAKYALLYSLAKLKQDIKALLPTVPEALIPLPDFIQPDLRQIVVHYWVPQAQPYTDIRWWLEYTLTEPPHALHLEQLAKASWPLAEQLAALISAQGIPVQEVIDYALEYAQGFSTVWLIKMQPDAIQRDESGQLLSAESLAEGVIAIENRYADHIYISQLAPYCYHRRCHKSVDIYAKDIHGIISSWSDYQGIGNADHYAVYQQAAHRLGLTWLTEEQLQFVVPGLIIYFFGEREPLSLQDLLFYWQD